MSTASVQGAAVELDKLVAWLLLRLDHSFTCMSATESSMGWQVKAHEKAAALADKLAAAEERKAAVREGVRERPRSANAHREAQVAELRAREKERAASVAEVRPFPMFAQHAHLARNLTWTSTWPAPKRTTKPTWTRSTVAALFEVRTLATERQLTSSTKLNGIGIGRQCLRGTVDHPQAAAARLAAASQRAAEALAARANGGLKDFMNVLHISPRPSDAGGSSATAEFELIDADGACL